LSIKRPLVSLAIRMVSSPHLKTSEQKVSLRSVVWALH